MKILLVRPPRIKQAITLSNFMFSEPLGLEMVFSVFEENHDVEIFDMMIEDISITEKIKTYKPNIVGITSLCIDVLQVIDLSREIKEFDHNIITFVGGTQALLSPESFFEESVDFVFNYTTKENLTDFISNKSNIPGVFQKRNDFLDVFTKSKNEYILPNRESTNKYRSNYSYFGYKPAAIMEYGLGCEKKCDFCLRWRIEGFKEFEIDKELTKKDLLNIKEKTIMFIDNDFLASRSKVKGFIDLILELNLDKNYIVYGSVNGVLENKDLLVDLKNLGLKAILIGYETFKDDELINYHKKATSLDNIVASEILKDIGIDVWASFIAHPDWSKSDFKTFRKYIKKLKPEITSINPLTPFPGLPLYNKYKDRLLFSKEDYPIWSFGQVTIMPSKVSLRMYYYQLLLTYLYVNLVVNKNTEMLKKFGMKNIIRILVGSIRASSKYLSLMIRN